LSDATTNLPPGAELLGPEWLGFDDTGEVGPVRFEARPSFTNRHRTIQGGFLAAMLDSATGIRALASLPSNLTAGPGAWIRGSLSRQPLGLSRRERGSWNTPIAKWLWRPNSSMREA
jgi:hypothetical protein